ncbi:MAG: peptidoglycan recognition family protein [Phycisphaerales bacterium]
MSERGQEFSEASGELMGDLASPAMIARRGFMLASLGFLAACASSGSTRSLVRDETTLPPGLWTSDGKLPPARYAQPVSPQAAANSAPAPSAAPRNPSIARAPAKATPAPAAAPKAGELAAGYNGKVITRAQWTPFCPNPKEMRALGGIRKITVHHTGNGVFRSTGTREVKDELTNILRGEMGVGHDDIAYHYIIDPAGRVWEGRSIRYQGSHVRNWKGVDNRTGNVGVMLLGNFELQDPTKAQLASVEAFVKRLQVQYKIPSRRVVGGRTSKDVGVFTHQQLSPTLCPGANMQARWTKDLFKRLPTRI